MTERDELTPLTRLLADLTDPVHGAPPLHSGAAVRPELLRLLAPRLGLLPADVFTLAGLDVPEDLAPADPAAGSLLPQLVRAALDLPSQRREALRAFVEALPATGVTRPARLSPVYARGGSGPGSLLMSLADNRNLGWTATAKTFLLLTGRYWAASSYGGVSQGRVPVTPELLIDFAVVLGVPATDLSLATGVPLPGTVPPPPPATSGVAGLVQDVRRLDREELRRVVEHARSLAQRR
ncbi:hypothetical protein [uncultured Streptomyces sp.]|uniref:hypothetical protein n=1 Tax=uncultured Streptomyces sp. TaxID=174707 RepID=UPI002630644E|nr:hypothetical protein [uncultured Streptomyces sp.]